MCVVLQGYLIQASKLSLSKRWVGFFNAEKGDPELVAYAKSRFSMWVNLENQQKNVNMRLDTTKCAHLDTQKP